MTPTIKTRMERELRYVRHFDVTLERGGEWPEGAAIVKAILDRHLRDLSFDPEEVMEQDFEAAVKLALEQERSAAAIETGRECPKCGKHNATYSSADGVWLCLCGAAGATGTYWEQLRAKKLNGRGC